MSPVTCEMIRSTHSTGIDIPAPRKTKESDTRIQGLAFLETISRKVRLPLSQKLILLLLQEEVAVTEAAEKGVAKVTPLSDLVHRPKA